MPRSTPASDTNHKYVMLYFKEGDIPYYDIIIQKSLDFVKKNDAAYFRKILSVSFYILNLDDYISDVPEIRLAFAEYNMRCTAVGTYVMYSPAQTRIHADGILNFARINLPLLNCKNTFTHFYSGCHSVHTVDPDSGIIGRYVTNPKEAKLEASIEMKKATVVRISEPHIVELPLGNPIPRITLSLSFDKDPIFLLD